MEYRMIRSNRKTVSLEITAEGELLVRCPQRMGKAAVDAFVLSKRSWVEKHLPDPSAEKPPVLTRKELEALADRALAVIPERVRCFAEQIGVSYGGITIRSQRTRWGSCSGKGNLNFNCLLMLAPEKVRDYVVVHELCHRKQMNHSPQFWAEVEKVLPDYRESRRWLKENGSALIARLP